MKILLNFEIFWDSPALYVSMHLSWEGNQFSVQAVFKYPIVNVGL